MKFEITDPFVGYNATHNDRGEPLPAGHVNAKRSSIFFSDASASDDLDQIAAFLGTANGANSTDSASTLEIKFNVQDLVASLRASHELTSEHQLVDARCKPEFEALRADLIAAIAQIDAIKWSSSEPQ